MNRLPLSKRVAVISALVEGCSVRATVRLTGVAKGTILNLLESVGQACAIYHDENVHGVQSKRIQCDEIWSFCHAKQKNLPEGYRGVFGHGDVWTWVGIDADSKLVMSYQVGDRTARTAYGFMWDLASRVRGRVQLTTDGHRAYLQAVDQAFEGREIDYAILDKMYASNPMEGRYSPATITSSKTTIIAGDPDVRHISTSYIERQNLTMRMHMRRFTRLTNGFSKKVQNHMHSVALFYMHYNFAKVHQTLRVTPAMEAGIANRVWSIQDIVELAEPEPASALAA
jgi:IS1 family transposase